MALALLLAGWLALPSDGNAAWIFCRYGPGNSRCVTSCPASARVHGRFATKEACQGAKIARMRSKGLLPPEASQTPRRSAAKKPPPSRKPTTTAAKPALTGGSTGETRGELHRSAAELATATSAAVQAMVDANAILPKMEPGGLRSAVEGGIESVAEALKGNSVETIRAQTDVLAAADASGREISGQPDDRPSRNLSPIHARSSAGTVRGNADAGPEAGGAGDRQFGLPARHGAAQPAQRRRRP